MAGAAVSDVEAPEAVAEERGHAGRKATVVLLVARGVVLAVFAWVLWDLAWMSDDALITLRHALNITHGWGPGFNATESVQAYTHPLWFLMWSGLGWVTGEWIVTITVASIALTLVSVGLVLWRTRSLAVTVLAAAALLLSNAFTEFAVSGLENPLSYLLVGAAILLAVSSRGSGDGLWWAVALGVAVAAVGLTRLDLLVVVGPSAAVWAWKQRRHPRTLVAAAAGFAVPFAAWHAWAYSTYGSLLPNTYAAKRNTNIPTAELVERGVRYIAFSFSQDMFSAVVLVVGVAAVVIWGTWKLRSVAAGVVLYLLYVAYVGGDFMAGRFLSVPVYVTVLCVVLLPTHRTPRWMSAAADTADGWIAALLAVFAVSALFTASALLGVAPTAIQSPSTPKWIWEHQSEGIADERGHYNRVGMEVKNLFGGGGGLARNLSIRNVRDAVEDYPRNTTGERLSAEGLTGVRQRCGGLGYYAIKNGPTVHQIDICGLSDAFIASIPYEKQDSPYVILADRESAFTWRAGHLDRKIPAGYIEAIREGDHTRVVDPELAERLGAIWDRIR